MHEEGDLFQLPETSIPSLIRQGIKRYDICRQNVVQKGTS
jgi:hypothetical protein